MKQISLIILIAVIWVGEVTAQESKSDFQSEIMPIQKNILAKLTGNQSIRNSTKLSDRWSGFARKIAENFLFESLVKIGLEPKKHHYKTKREGTNIYAVIPATSQSDEYIVLGAHFDSVRGSPGANDNASGTTLVFGVAYKLAKLKLRKLNFIIVFFDQEESGLIGSRAFAHKLKSEGVNLHSAHTIDQMGWDKDGDRAIELELPTAELEAVYRSEAKKLSIPVHKTDVPSTDHTAFREIGFKAIGVTEEYRNNDTTPHYHKGSDSYETINFGYLASTTHLVFNVMKHFAKN